MDYPNIVFKYIAIGLLIALVIGGIVAWQVYQWHLCREAGLKFWYCVKHIT